ncbi:hypothetical protein Z043_117668 [Scleropages formosus]|uniref:Uncharacterized protein n=1 Tax=Scleropages formosus TaxID=113540 RepID=A0A0P7U122_SCLFO|nr:hypothetical protein Z043_117668 [Scleropages formosus]
MNTSSRANTERPELRRQSRSRLDGRDSLHVCSRPLTARENNTSARMNSWSQTREVVQNEKKWAEEKQDDLSFASEFAMESKLSRGTCCSSLDSLDDLSAAGESDGGIGWETALAPPIQQRVQQVKQQQHSSLEVSTTTKQEGLEVELRAGLDVQRDHEADLGSSLRNSVTTSQSENNLNCPALTALSNGFHTVNKGLPSSTCTLPNSFR